MRVDFATFLILVMPFSVGIYAVAIIKLLIICVILIRILCAKDALRVLIMYVYE